MNNHKNNEIVLNHILLIKKIGLYNMNNNTTVRNIGIGLTLIGLILLMIYTFYEILASNENLILKLSIAAILLGITAVLFSLVKEKTAAKDKEIERKY